MNAELQELRRHYQNLDAHVKARKTAQSLLRAIQIAEARELAGSMCSNICYNLSQDDSIRADYRHSMREAYKAWDLSARVTKPEGE